MQGYLAQIARGSWKVALKKWTSSTGQNIVEGARMRSAGPGILCHSLDDCQHKAHQEGRFGRKMVLGEKSYVAAEAAWERGRERELKWQ